jgi:hypothetical protein
MQHPSPVAATQKSWELGTGIAYKEETSGRGEKRAKLDSNDGKNIP